jgi:hypothetical protein
MRLGAGYTSAATPNARCKVPAHDEAIVKTAQSSSEADEGTVTRRARHVVVCTSKRCRIGTRVAASGITLSAKGDTVNNRTIPQAPTTRPADQSVAGEDPGAALDALRTPTATRSAIDSAHNSPAYNAAPPKKARATKTTKPERSLDNDPPMQGEGNYTAARRYDKAQEAFVKAGKVGKAAHKAKPKGPREAQELAEAEKAGRDKAKR